MARRKTYGEYKVIILNKVRSKGFSSIEEYFSRRLSWKLKDMAKDLDFETWRFGEFYKKFLKESFARHMKGEDNV